MTSEAYVWVYLPGDTEPTLCGRYSHLKTHAQPVGAFVYGSSYLKNSSAIPIDPIALPLRNTEYRSTNSTGIFGALSDSLPDDWGRYVIDRLHGNQDYPIGYMQFVSDDAVGNLAFSKSPIEAPSREEPIDESQIAVAREILTDLESGKEVPPELIGKVRANTAMGGARPKITVEVDGRLWLAKFAASKDDKLIPVSKLESATLKLSKLCGIESVNARVVQEDVLLVERFDRGALNNIHRARRDSFLSARTVFESNGQRYSYVGSYVRLATELQRYSCQAHKDKQELFLRMIFNALISNTDDHDRNHGLIADDEPGAYRLSPAYDMVPRISGTSVRHQAMILSANTTEATKENLLRDCTVFGYTDSEAESIFENVRTSIAQNWRQCMANDGISSEGIDRLERCFSGIPDKAEIDIRRSRDRWS